MHYKTLFFVMIVLIIGCDAHMQKGLEVYQDRYTEPVTARDVDRTKFFMVEDNVDSVFLTSDTHTKPKVVKTNNPVLKAVTKAEVLSEGGIVKVVFQGDGELGMYKTVKNLEKNEIMFIVKNAEAQGIPNILDANSEKLKRIRFVGDKTKNHLVIIFEFFTDVPLPDVKVQKDKTGFSIEF